MRPNSSTTLKTLAASVTAYATLITTPLAAETPTKTATPATPEVLASLSAKLALHPGLALKIAGIHGNPTASLVKAKRAEPVESCTSSVEEASTPEQPAPATATKPQPRPAFSVHAWLTAAATWFPKAGSPPATKKPALTPAELAQQKATATGAYAPAPPAKAYIP